MSSGGPPQRRNLAGLVAFNASAQVVGLAISSLAGLIAVGLVARYLGRGDYGVFVAATAFVTLLQLVSDFGIEPVAIRRLAREPEHRDDELGAVLVLGSVTNLLAGVVAVAGAYAVFGGDDATFAAITILSVQMVFGGVRLAGSSTLNARQQAYWLATANASARVITLGLTVTVVAVDAGFLAVVASQAAFAPLRAGLTAFFARRDLAAIRRPPRRDLRDLLRRATPMGLVSAINYAYFRIDLLLVAALAGAKEVALYGLAYKVVEVLQPVPGFVMATLLPALSMEEEQSTRLQDLVGKAVTLMVLVATPVLCLIPVADEITSLLGGDSFVGAGPVLGFLLIGVCAAFVQGVFGFTLVAQNRQTQALWASGTVLCCNVALNVALIPSFGAVGAAVALAMTELLSLALAVRIVDVAARWWVPRPVVAAAAVASVAAATAAAFLARQVAAADLAALVVAPAAGVLVLIGFVVAFSIVPRDAIAGAAGGLRRGRP